MAAPLILVEASPRDPATGAVVPTRLAGGGADKPYPLGYLAGIAALPGSTASLDFNGEQLGGGGVASAMELRWSPATSAAVAALAGLYWGDAPVTVRVGPESAALPPIDTKGLVLEAAVDGGALRLALADAAVDLKRPLLVDRFAGTGGIEGPAELAGQLKWRAWGRCFNVPGRVLDVAARITCFGDPTRPWEAFDQVRDRGAAAASLTVLGWQGSAQATLDALRAAAAPEGGGVAAPSIACVKWWTLPAGDLRADIRGENAGGYVETAAEIAGRIVAARSALAFADGAIAAAKTARPGPFGWRVAEESATAAEQLSELLAGVSLSWVLLDDKVDFRRWEWTAPTRTARSHAVERRRVHKPVATRRLGYRRNWSPMARGDLAAIVLASDIAYEDGTVADAIAAVEADMAALDLSVENALDTIEEAAEALRGAGDDGTLTVDEKIRILIPADAKLDAAWQLLDAQAAGIAGDTAVTGARSTASSARQAWQTYRNGLSPAWNNKTMPTAVTRSTFNGKLGDYEWSLTNLAQALRDYGLRRTNAAFETVARLGSDGWLTAGSEKQQTEIEYQALVSRLAAVVNRWQGLGQPALTPATALPDAGFAIYPEYGPANGRAASLGYYLEHLNPSYLSRNTDTQVDPAEWSARWKTAYDKTSIAEAALIGIVGSAVQSAVDAIAVISADGKWSPFEKRSTLLQQHAELEANYALLNNAAAAIAGSATLDAARVAAGNKRQAWLDFLGTVPSWSNPDVETVVNRGEARSKVVAYGDALNALAEGLRVYTDARAATALQRLDDLASDGKLTPEEKWLFVNLWRTLVNRYQRAVDRYLELGLQGGRIPAVTQKQQDAYKALGPDGNAPESSLGKFLGALTPAWDNGAVTTPVPDPAALKAKFEAAASAVDAFILAMSAQPDADNTSSAIAGGAADAPIASKVAASPKLARLDAGGRATSTRINSIYALRGAQQVYIPTNGNTNVGGTVQAGQPGSPLWSYTDPGGGPTATIQVFDHKLIDDEGTLNFGGGFMFNVQQGTQYWVYEDGAGYTGGNPTYVATTSAEALNAPNRRMVGSTFTPTTARVGAGGGTSGGGGGGGGIRERYYENQLTQQP